MKKETDTRAGFTLVELVVVIAIMGILAGVGYASYGAYIKYAQQAADKELIGSVNEAFAAACEDQGVARLDLKPNAASLDSRTDENGLNRIQGIASVNSVSDIESFKSSFSSYFSGNEGTALKYFEPGQIRFINGTDLFTVDEDKIASQDRQNFVDSIFNEDREGILETIHKVLFTLGNRMNAEQNDRTLDGFLHKLTGGVGLSSLGLDPERLKEGLAKYGITADSNPTAFEIANGILLCVTEESSKVDPSVILDKYVNGNTSAFSDGLVEGPLSIAIAKALVQSGSASDGLTAAYNEYLEKPNGTHLLPLCLAIQNEIKDPTSSYQEWKTNGMLEDTINGYLSLCSVFNQNAGAFDGELLFNLRNYKDKSHGYGKLLDLMTSIFGEAPNV